MTTREFIETVHESFNLFPPFNTDCGKNLHFGKRVFVNSGCKFQDQGGIFDTMSHIMEQYFSGDDDSTSDYLAEGLMRSVIASSRIAVKDPENYEARSNIMWSATWALNTLVSC